MNGLDKTYEAAIALGASTTTLDAAGEVTGEWDMSEVTLHQVRAAAATLTGAIAQVPPMVSAVKVGGRRLHEIARAGEHVERVPRPVVVYRFDVESLDRGILHTTIECSSGTYVRVLAADLGEALGGGAHVRSLRRTAVGPWMEADAVPLDELGSSDVRPPAEALPWLPSVTATPGCAAEVSHGKVLERELLGLTGDGPWRVVGATGDLLAVYIAHGPTRAKPAVVLASAS
jgi:tRNA pseudouridine55 synthase